MSNPILENQISEENEETVDTSDPQAVNKSKKRAARKRADRLKFIEAAMGLEEGRAWFYDLLVFCKVFQGPFSSDPYQTAFLCGEQNIGLRVLDDIQTAAPKQYLTMVSENKRNKE